MANKIQKNLLLLGFSLTTTILAAQTDVDALRYSYLQPGSTARSLGVGGSMGALGADFSTASSNPAGLAHYRQAELSISPSFIINSAATTFENTVSKKTKIGFNFEHIALVIPSNNEGKRWTNISFGMGYNRLANYSSRMYFDNTTKGSLSEQIALNANNQSPDQLDVFEGNLAFNTYFIDTVNSSTSYASILQNSSKMNIQKQQSVNKKGGYGEVPITLAATYKDKLSIGATIGIPLINYVEDKTYQEKDINEEDSRFDKMSYSQYLRTTGTGINLKLGAIYRGTTFRIGAAVHTPTYIALKDSFYNTMTTSFTLPTENVDFSAQSPTGVYKYSMLTPSRLIGNFAYLFQDKGFLTAEIEGVDYGRARYIFDKEANPDDQEYETKVNNLISNKYKFAINARLGGELAWETFRFRIGYGYYDSPFKSGVSTADGTRHQVTGGIGLREKHFSLDLGYARTFWKEEYVPFASDLATATRTMNNLTRDRIVLTFGLRF